MADLKQVYCAVNKESAMYALEEFKKNGIANIHRYTGCGNEIGRIYQDFLNIRYAIKSLTFRGHIQGRILGGSFFFIQLSQLSV